MDPAASERTVRLLGPEAFARLEAARVLVLGLGGVGSWCAEALARAGVGALDLVDSDVYVPSNLNRQLGALVSTLGRPKAEVERERVLAVNPDARVRAFVLRYDAESAPRLPLSLYDAVVDAIDLVSSKLLLLRLAREAGVPVFSAMGGGNKLDAARFRISRLSATNRDPLAKAMRKKLRRVGADPRRVVAVASDEEPRAPFAPEAGTGARHVPPGTLPHVVGVEGLLLAQAVLDRLAGPPAAPLACQARDAALRAACAGAVAGAAGVC
ncbi:MAG: ThiF family adenylyltransferase [Kiritimatiellae bacterium]|nr:ThiF family adenylyltransferase [Kiritimatiellia bacterium]